MMRTFLIVFLFFLFFEGQSAYRKVTIKSSVHVSENTVYLKDLLLDPDLVTEEERAYSIIVAPKAKKYYSLKTLAYAMQQHKSLKDLQLYGGRLIKVVRVADEKLLSDLQLRIKDFVSTKSPWNDYEISVKIPEVELQKVAFYTDVSSFKIKAIENGLRMRGGKVFVALYKKDKLYRTVQLKVDISRRVKAVLLERNFKSGDILNSTDLVLGEKWISGEVRGLIQTVKEAEGYELKYGRSQGQFLLNTDLLQPVYVLKNQKIKAQISIAGLSVTAAVKAMSRGRRGDLVRVKNEKSGEVFQARVVGDRLVEVQ